MLPTDVESIMEVNPPVEPESEKWLIFGTSTPSTTKRFSVGWPPRTSTSLLRSETHTTPGSTCTPSIDPAQFPFCTAAGAMGNLSAEHPEIVSRNLGRRQRHLC